MPYKIVVIIDKDQPAKKISKLQKMLKGFASEHHLLIRDYSHLAEITHNLNEQTVFIALGKDIIIEGYYEKLKRFTGLESPLSIVGSLEEGHQISFAGFKNAEELTSRSKEAVNQNIILLTEAILKSPDTREIEFPLHQKYDVKKKPDDSPARSASKLKTISYEQINHAKQSFHGEHYAKIAGTTYRVSKLTAWMHFSAKKDNSSHKNKIHITLDRNPENYSKGYDIIFAALIKNKIKQFKIVPMTGLQKGDDHSNSHGKEFVIFMNSSKDDPESSPELWIDMLNEIESELYQNRIKPGVRPKGDLIFPGSLGYTFQRSSKNIWNQYISATLLEENGFTATESSNLTPVNFQFFGTMKLHWGLADSKLIIQDSKKSAHLGEGIVIDSFPEKRKSSIKEQFYQANDKTLRLIFLGKTKPNDNFNHSLISKLFPGFFEKCECLAPIFDRSAEIVAKIHSALGFKIKKEDYIGNIYPALYFKFFLPLVKFIDDKITAKETPEARDLSGDVLEKSSALLTAKLKGPIAEICNEDELVEYIVKCSLRDRSKSQIRNVEPQNILDLLEEDVSKLVLDGMKKTPTKIITDKEISSEEDQQKPSPTTSEPSGQSTKSKSKEQQPT